MQTIPAEHVELMSDEEREVYQTYLLHKAIEQDDWEAWLPAIFPSYCYAPFADHHREFWKWVWRIERGKRSSPWVSCWNRGSAKSTSAEMAVVALGVRGVKRYVLYISGTQDQADDHVANVAALLESPQLNKAYPKLGERAVGKYGNSKGWRRNRLSTESGLTIDAMGLDVAARGIKMEDQRPDLIVLDDIDEEGDSPAKVAKKIKSITRKLIPAGSQDCAVMVVQNKVHDQSIMAMLISENRVGEPVKADFLADRIISGPIPAVEDLEWEQFEDHFVITAGTPTWEGMPIESCQGLLSDIGLSAFLAECQHEDADLKGEMFDHLDFASIRVAEHEIPDLVHVECWVDPAISSTDRSDSCGIQIDGLGEDKKIYRLFSWEQVATPLKVMKVAIRHAIQWKAAVVGIETDQGGDTWRSVFELALLEMRDAGELEGIEKLPKYEYDKASKTSQSKIERATEMLVGYETGLFRHVEGTSVTLEKALARFPKFKPYDLVDAAYWSSKHVRAKRLTRNVRVSSIAKGRTLPEVSMHGLP